MVLGPVPHRPGFWQVRQSAMSFGFREGRMAEKPPIEMHESKLIELKLKQIANETAKTLRTVGGSGPKPRSRKLRDNKPIRRVLPAKFSLIHQALLRIKAESEQETA